jgi:hypothetical protein
MHGSLQDVNIDGVSFVPVADVDAQIVPNEWENEAIPNGSGPASIQSVRKVPGVSGVTLRVDSTEIGFLRTYADSGEWKEFIMTLRDGSVWNCYGLLKLDEVSTANGTAAISVQCQTKWDIKAA